MAIASLVTAAVVVVCLSLLALLHVYWGFGGAWPARSQAELGPMVVGTPPGRAMPNTLACLAVATLLTIAAVLVGQAGLGSEPAWVWRVGSAGVGVVLLAQAAS